jgi:hypothetical protein
MAVFEADGGGGSLFGAVDEGGLEVGSGASDTDVNWHVLAMDDGCAFIVAGDGGLGARFGENGSGQQEKAGKKLHAWTRFYSWERGLKLDRHAVSGRGRRLRRPAGDSGNNRDWGGTSSLLRLDPREGWGQGKEPREALFAGVYGVGGALDGDVRLDGKEVIEGGALVVVELAVEAIGAEDGLALGLGHLSEIAEGTLDETAAIGWERGELLRGAAYLLALSRSEVLEGLVAGEETAALLIGHVVELGEAIEEALLVLLGKLVEAGLVLKSALLLIWWEIAMAIHPLGEMLLVGLGADG